MNYPLRQTINDNGLIAAAGPGIGVSDRRARYDRRDEYLRWSYIGVGDRRQFAGWR